MTLATSNPTMALREVVLRELERGEYSRDELFAAIDRARLDLRNAGNEEAEDLMAEVMDFMVGWSSPRMKTTKAPADPPTKDGTSRGASTHHNG